MIALRKINCFGVNKLEKMLLEIPSKLETGRLCIRKYEEGDGRSFYDLLERNNNRAFLRNHIDEAITLKDANDAEIRIRQLSAFWVSRERFVLGIWLKASQLFIGQIWIEPKNLKVPSFELGWFLDQAYQGKGLATEAVIKSTKFLFEDLKAHKIIVLTRDDNIRSKKLAERCGYIKEGHLRDHNVSNGKRFGLYCYGMLKSEYQCGNLFK